MLSCILLNQNYRSMPRKILIFLSLCLLNNTLLYSQAESPFNASFEKKVVTLLRENQVPTAAVGVIENNRIICTKVFGDSTGVKNASTNLLFNVASLTKPVAMMLTLTLVSQGLWDLDEPLANYWIDPDVKDDALAYKLTTRHVLSHQGGFVNWRSMHTSGKLVFDTVPGTKFHYSGEGFEYLRHAIEKKFDQSLDKLIDSFLFKPLGMSHSYLCWNAELDALPYAGRFDQKGEKYPLEKNNAVNAAASLITTIDDYTRFGLACLNANGLSEELAEQMQTPQIIVPQADQVGIGLSWVVISNLKDGQYALMHSGSDPGIKTLVVLLPESKQGVVIFTNSDNGKKVYEEILRETLDVGAEILSRMN